MFAAYRLCAFSALILVICCGLPVAKAASLNYTNICLLINTNELIASADSCSDYYACQNGGVAMQRTCTNGQYFSKDAQSCLPASSVNCFNSSQNPCSVAKLGSWAAVPGSCSSFYYCGAKGAVLGNCPLGENFNPSAQACQYADQYPCGVTGTGQTADNMGMGVPSERTTINLCAFLPNGVFFGSPSSCSDWHLCKNNAMTTGSCPAGYMFNTQIHKCDYSSNVNCAQVTNDPNLTDSPSVGGPCNTPNAQKGAAQCNAYYVCNGASYQLYYCQHGLYYDTVSGTCTSRMNARNNCDRCLGSTNQFVNMYSSSNCAGYLYCQNGVEHSSGYCPTGSYFNELAGACIAGEDPNFGCCNPSVVYGTASATNDSIVTPPSSPTTLASESTESTESSAST